ncbi:hypothetical protein FQZ97_482640 [compost metagenome]
MIEPVDSTSSLPRFVAFGSSARATLAGINREIRASNAPQAKSRARRVTGQISLKRLRGQLGGAA